jgi:hypothetical protein
VLVDGGYVDNTGTETLAALIGVLLKAAPIQPFSLVVLVPEVSGETVQQTIGIPGNFETLPVLDALLKSRNLLSSSREKLKSLMQSLSKDIPSALVEIPLQLGSSVPLGWCLTQSDKYRLRDALWDKLPEYGPADPFPPQRVDLSRDYLTSLELEGTEFHANWASNIRDWPDCGYDPRLTPQLLTIQPSDLPEFMKKCYGISARERGQLFSIQDAIEALKEIRHAREYVLEARRKPVERIDLVMDSLSSPSSKPSLYDFNRSYPEYLNYAFGILNNIDHPKPLQGWLAELDFICKGRWEEAIRSYKEAIALFQKINTRDGQEATAVIEAELNQLEGMYRSRWP